MADTVPVFAIDGPSGSGKGTVSRALARRLGWHFLDSGAIYRAVALAVERDGIAVGDEAGVVATAAAIDLQFSSAEIPSVRLDGCDVTDLLQTETCGGIASRIAAMPALRRVLLQKQRDFRRHPGLVADGRDMGTVVFPDAEYKVFLTASAAERARRRHKQLKEKGLDVNLERLTEEIEERDRRDQSRAEAPLRVAEGAVEIDSSCLTAEQVIDQCLGLMKNMA
jgi:cytidylate kinase